MFDEHVDAAEPLHGGVCFALGATHEHKQTRWRAAVSRALAARLTDTDEGRELLADALSGSALACLHAAEVAWVAGDGQPPLSDLLDRAMSAVAPIR